MSNGDAFAYEAGVTRDGRRGSGGLTKREVFAMAAMQGALTTAAAPCLTGMQGAEPEVAKQAVRMADALLAELEKVKP